MTTVEALVSMAQTLVRYDLRNNERQVPTEDEIILRTREVAKLAGANFGEVAQAIAEIKRRMIPIEA